LAYRQLLVFPLFTLALAGCGSSAANALGDAGLADASSALLGAACSSGSCTPLQEGTCATGGVCLPASCGGQDNGFPNGYCSQVCGTAGSSCPANAACVAPRPDQPSVQLCFGTCTADSNCRLADGYGCQTIAGQQICYPVPQDGGNNAGAACVPPPATLPTAGFTSPNLAVPNGTGDIIDSEGNVATDGAGHAAVSFIAVGAAGSGEGVASYDGTAFAAGPQIFQTSFHPGFTSDPVVAWDRSTTPPRLYVSYIDLEGTGGGLPTNYKVMVAHSDQNGAGGWSTPVAVSGGDATGVYALDKPWIVARHGIVVVTYMRAPTMISSNIRVVRSVDGGATWSSPIDADALLPQSFRNLAEPALDDAGDLWVTWFEAGFNYAIEVAEQPAGMAAFGQPVMASGSRTPGTDDPSIDVTADGTSLWLAFTDNSAATGSDLWAGVSHDGGQSFPTLVKVNDDAVNIKAPAPCASRYHPQLAVDSTGRAHVLFYDNRWLTGQVLYSYSLSDTSFAPNTVVNDRSFSFTTSRSSTGWLGDYLGIAVDASTVYGAWADSRTGVSHMYFATRPLPP
jgi:hypothetical protein